MQQAWAATQDSYFRVTGRTRAIQHDQQEGRPRVQHVSSLCCFTERRLLGEHVSCVWWLQKNTTKNQKPNGGIRIRGNDKRENLKTTRPGTVSVFGVTDVHRLPVETRKKNNV